MSLNQVHDALPLLSSGNRANNRGTFTLFASPTAGGTVLHINSIGQGTASSQRVGRVIRMTGIEIRGIMYQALVPATAPFDIVRFSLVYDKQPTGALPVVTDIFTNTLISGCYQYDSFPRFQVIREWFLSIGTITNSGTTSPPVAFLNDYVELDHRTTYRSTAGSIPNVSRGALYLVYDCQTANCVLDFVLPIYWKDD